MIKLNLSTPSNVIYENETVERISIPTTNGINVVLANHEPIISALSFGQIIIYRKTDNIKGENIIIDGGIFKFLDNSAEILVDFAEKADDVLQADIQAAIDRAKSLINDKTTDIEIAELQKFIFREELKLKYKTR
jgi:ATP synthase F1 epsilon subunit